MRSRQRLILWSIACALIVSLSGGVYAGSLGGEFVWDDHWIVTGQAIGGGDTLLHCFTQPFLFHYFRPFVSVSFFLQRKLFGYDPAGYRLVNLLLHMASTGILMCLLLEAFGRMRIAVAGSLLFAVQPAQVGAVAWIGGHTDVLCAFWTALFAWGLIRAAREQGDARSFCLSGSVLAYTAALFTKEQTLALLPLVPLAFRCFPPRRGVNVPRTEWWATLPYVVAVAFFLTMGFFLGLPHEGGVNPGFSGLLAQAGRTFAYYALLLFIPTAKGMHTLSLGAMERAGAWPVAAGWGVVVLSVVLFRRWRRTEPAACWFLALTALSLLPVSNLLPLPFILVAPYRAGVAGIGAAALLGWVVGSLGRWVVGLWGYSQRPNDPTTQSPSYLVLLLLAVWWGGLTAWGAAQWRSEVRIFSTIVRYDPDSIVARYVLAWNMMNLNRRAEAIAQLEAILRLLFGSNAWESRETAVRAVRSDPRILDRARQNQGSRDDPRRWVASLYAYLGNVRTQTGALDLARAAYLTGDALYAGLPDINYGLGYLAVNGKNYVEAERRMRAVVAADPNNSWAHYYLGYIYQSWEQWQAAYDEYSAWARLNPDSEEAEQVLDDLRQYLPGPISR
jgi:hypothetical protein